MNDKLHHAIVEFVRLGKVGGQIGEEPYRLQLSWD